MYILALITFHSTLLPRPFRFEEFWTRDPTCRLLTDTAWNMPVIGSLALCVVKKLNHTKDSLKRWNSLHFKNIQAEIKSTMAKINKIQQLPRSPNSSSIKSNLKIAQDDLFKEYILWKSKFREIWLTCTYFNTKIFHTSFIIKIWSNAVNFLQTSSRVGSLTKELLEGILFITSPICSLIPLLLFMMNCWTSIPPPSLRMTKFRFILSSPSLRWSKLSKV